jgi:hypothetical protein
MVDFRDKATYFHLLSDGKAFLECVFAFLLFRAWLRQRGLDPVL